MKLLYALLPLITFVSSCHGQNKSQQQVPAPKTIPAAQPGIVKTQGTDPSANIHCSLLDRTGNLWFCTTGEGVYRFDGKSFTNFTTKDGLCNNMVWAVLEDKAGNIWFGTDGGACRYDGNSFTGFPVTATNRGYFSPNISPNNNPLAKNTVWSMMQDKNGTIWFGKTDGLYCYNGTIFTRFLDSDSIINNDSLSLQSVQCMLEDKNGNIWFGSGPPALEGVCRYDGKFLTDFKPGGQGWIRYMLEDRNGNLWFGTRSKGIWRHTGDTLTRFMEGNDIGVAVLEDKAGNIWFGGNEKLNTVEGDGIWRYDGRSLKNFSTKDGFSKYSVWSMVEDNAGNIWFGTRNVGLYRYDGKTFTGFSQ